MEIISTIETENSQTLYKAKAILERWCCIISIIFLIQCI